MSKITFIALGEREELVYILIPRVCVHAKLWQKFLLGNTGIAILLYELKNKSRVSRIEKDSGVKFEHISAPESAGTDESAESLAATAITNVNR